MALTDHPREYVSLSEDETLFDQQPSSALNFDDTSELGRYYSPNNEDLPVSPRKRVNARPLPRNELGRYNTEEKQYDLSEISTYGIDRLEVVATVQESLADVIVRDGLEGDIFCNPEDPTVTLFTPREIAQFTEDHYGRRWIDLSNLNYLGNIWMGNIDYVTSQNLDLGTLADAYGKDGVSHVVRALDRLISSRMPQESAPTSQESTATIFDDSRYDSGNGVYSLDQLSLEDRARIVQALQTYGYFGELARLRNHLIEEDPDNPLVILPLDQIVATLDIPDDERENFTLGSLGGIDLSGINPWSDNINLTDNSSYNQQYTHGDEQAMLTALKTYDPDHAPLTAAPEYSETGLMPLEEEVAIPHDQFYSAWSDVLAEPQDHQQLLEVFSLLFDQMYWHISSEEYMALLRPYLKPFSDESIPGVMAYINERRQQGIAGLQQHIEDLAAIQARGTSEDWLLSDADTSDPLRRIGHSAIRAIRGMQDEEWLLRRPA